MSIANHLRVTSKMLVSTAIALAACLGAAAPASANTTSASADPNPFSTLSCNCRQTAPGDGTAQRDEIHRGILNGLSAELPGLPRPAQPGQPRH
jgi:hypothetical protein